MKKYLRPVALKPLLALSIALIIPAPASAAQIELPSVPHYILVPQAPPKSLAAPRYIAVSEHSGAEPGALGGQNEAARSFIRRQQISPDDPLSVLKLMLGLAVVFLSGLTVLLWRTTRRTARSRALIELERPFLFAAVSKPGLLVTPGRPVFEVSVFNLGRTPATLTHLEYNLVLVDRGGIADPIDPQHTSRPELPLGTISATNHPYSESTEMPRLLHQEAQIADGSLSVWLVGFVKYRDIWNGHYITGFARIFDGIGKKFVVRGDDRYNYTRKDVADEMPASSPSQAGSRSLAKPPNEAVAGAA